MAGLVLDFEGLDGADEFLDRDVPAAVVAEDVEDLLSLPTVSALEVLPHVLVRVECCLSCLGHKIFLI